MKMKKELPKWYRLRRYIHFDEPLNLKHAEKLVMNPDNVASHSFWPLIRFDVNIKKISQDKKTKEIKTKPKVRPISYAAHSDSLIYSFYCENLSKLYEDRIKKEEIDDVVLAFRSLGKNNIDFAKKAFDEIKLRQNCSVIALDITKFFDTLSHKKLKHSWKNLINLDRLPKDHLAIYNSVTKFSYVDREKLFELLKISNSNPRSDGRKRICTPKEFREIVRTQDIIESNPLKNEKKGIPQGTSLSALLSNIYMLEFDIAASRFAKQYNGKYMRYCDDMLFIMPLGSGKLTEDFAEDKIKELEIEINPDKTDRCDFIAKSGLLSTKKPLQYLGFLFDGERTIIRSAAFAKYSNRVKRGVSLAKQTMRRKNEIKNSLGCPETNLYKKQIFSRYSHLGKRNFIRYGYKAANILNSNTIRKQLRPLWWRLLEEIKSQKI